MPNSGLERDFRPDCEYFSVTSSVGNPPYVSTVLPTVRLMEYPILGYSRIPFEGLCVDLQQEHCWPGLPRC